MSKPWFVDYSRQQLELRKHLTPEQKKRMNRPVGTNPRLYYQRSDAAGVNPSQIPQQMEADRRLGVPIQYDHETGEAIFESPGQRREYCEAHGLFDLNGGYYDPDRDRMRQKADHVRDMRDNGYV